MTDERERLREALDRTVAAIDDPTRYTEVNVHYRAGWVDALRAVVEDPALAHDRPTTVDEVAAALDRANASLAHEEPAASYGRRSDRPSGSGLYERRVGAVADAIHETCRLEWQAAAVVDPGRLVTQHMSDAHYGEAHDIVRRLDWGVLSGSSDPEAVGHEPWCARDHFTDTPCEEGPRTEANLETPA